MMGVVGSIYCVVKRLVELATQAEQLVAREAIHLYSVDVVHRRVACVAHVGIFNAVGSLTRQLVRVHL